MARRRTTIRNRVAAARAASPCGRWFARAALLLLLFTGRAFAAGGASQTPTLTAIANTANVLAISSNNASGQTAVAVLNNDSSVFLVQNGALSGQSCPAFTNPGSGSTVTHGDIFYDSANSRIYVAMVYGGTLYAGYETLTATAGQCTQEPLAKITASPNEFVEMNVDLAQGSIYIVNSLGAFFDTLYVLPTAPWTGTPSSTSFNLDYSSTYGPIVIDTSSHLVFIDDLSNSAYGPAGTYSTAGFFVYDPATSASQWVAGYSAGGTTTPFNAAELLTDDAGKLILINANPSAKSAYLTQPLYVLDTTQFSFFSNTVSVGQGKVDIQPGAGLTAIAAASQYNAIGSADLDLTDDLLYAYAYDVTTPVAATGSLLAYNLSPSASPVETVVSSGVAMPPLYNAPGNPWSQLNYNPESTQLVLSASAEGSGALAITSPVCSASSNNPLSLTILYGSNSSVEGLSFPVVNTASGYTYVNQPTTTLDSVAPEQGCGAPVLTAPTVSVSVAGSSPYSTGAPLQATVTVSGGSSTATGTVTLSGDGYTSAAATLNSGSATVAIPAWSLAAGTNLTLTAAYTPDSNSQNTYKSATGSSAAFAVQAVVPAVTVQPSSTSITSAQPLSVSVSVSGGAGSPTADGNVTLTSGSYSSTAAPLSNGSAIIMVAAGALAVGSNTLTANYAPGAASTGFFANATGSTSVPVTVVQAPAPATVTDIEAITVSDVSPRVLNSVVADSETIHVADSLVAVIPQLSVSDSAETIHVMDTVAVVPQLIVTTATLPPGAVGSAYAQTLAAAGGSGTGQAWLVTAGNALSAVGLKLSANGAISGTPTLSETASAFTVQVTDSAGNTATRTLALTVDAALAIAPATLPAGVAETAYSQALTATGGAGGPYAWSLSAGAASLSSLGLSLSSGGTISGTPTAGQASFTAQVADSAGNTAAMAYQLTVNKATATVTLSNLMQTYNGTPLTVTVTTIPKGLSTTCTYAGSASPPVNAGTYAVVCTVSDANYQGSASGTLAINNPVPVIGSTSPASATAGGSATAITVNGTGFAPGIVANWGTAALTTSYVSVTQLTAQVPAADIAAAGTFAVTVTNPAPGGGTSNQWQFAVASAPSGDTPTVQVVTATVTPGSTATYTVTAPSGASNLMVTCLNLPPGASCSYLNGTLTVTTSSTTPAGTYTIVVVFTESVPGSAPAGALIFLPVLLLPLFFARRRWDRQRVWMIAGLGLLLAIAGVANACGGGPRHTVTAATSVTLTVT